MSTNDPVFHALHLLNEYPVLATLAHGRTEATRLDGRACRYIYEIARHCIDWQVVSARELEFMERLGVAQSDIESKARPAAAQVGSGI